MERLEIAPLTATIGAEIGGVDLASDVSDDVIADIRAALLEWKVIFFRDQHGLDRERHIAFGRRFGDLEVHPLTPADQKEPEIFVLPSEGKMRAPDVWHSDVTWRPEPSMGSILRIVESPPLGGDTLWADMGAAYARGSGPASPHGCPRASTHGHMSVSASSRWRPPLAR